MNIGILSMQKVVNYGSFMQAYALKKIIENITSTNIDFLDIEQGKKLPEVQITKIKKLKNIIKIIIKGLFFEKIKDKIFMKKLQMQFENDFFPILIKGSREEKCKKYSTVVIGSDEVFHCTQNASWGFSTQLLGDVKNAENVISYAASFGATTLEKINKLGIKKDVIENLTKLKKISVRDDNSYDIIKNLIGKESEVLLDPVLIYDFSKEIAASKNITVNNKYLIVYSYTGRITDTKEIKNIKNFANKKGLKIYTIFCRYKWADKYIIPESPFQMLRYFKNAEYVISDTFHGSIFSIITHKNFCTLVRDSNFEKMKSLLKILKLDDRAINDSSLIFETLNKEIDYSSVDEIRKYEFSKSLRYLKENIV